MVDKNSRNLFLVFGTLFLVFGMWLVLAQISVTPESFSVNETVNYNYNITVANSNGGQDANITQVNITLPGEFTFTINTNESNATFETFTNTTTVLSWTNTSEYLINGSDSAWFSFNTTSNTPGDYNFTITVVNGTDSYEENVSVQINDTIAPAVTIVSPSDNANLSGTGVLLNASVTDSGTIDTVFFNISNSTFSQTYTATNTSLTSWNATLDTTALSCGDYNITVVGNDSVNNINNTEYVTITIDNTAPTISLSKSSSTRISITVDYSCTDSLSGVDSCTLSSSAGSVSGSTISELSCGTEYTITVDTQDNEANTATTSEEMSTDSCAGSGGTPAFWTSTYNLNDKQIEEEFGGEGFSRRLKEKGRVRFKVENQEHHLGISKLTETTATINVSSTPQQKTLSVGDEWKVDVSDDGYYDVLVTLNDIKDDDADITMKAIDEEVIEESLDESEESSEEGEESNEGTDESDETGEEGGEEEGLLWLWILIAVIIVLGVAGFVFYQKKGRSSKK